MSLVKPGRNDACACGSRKKYKKCCGRTQSVGPALPQAAPPTDFSRLVVLVRGGHHAELEVEARALLMTLPSSGILWKLLSVSLWMQSKDALSALEMAATLLPDDAEAQSNFGNALRSEGRYEEAVQYQRRALSIKPDYAEAHNNLGSALQDLEDLDGAAASFRRAVEIKPQFALAHSNLASVLSLQNRIGESEDSCRRALELDPRLTAAIVLQAELAASRGEFAEAEQTLRNAIVIEPDMPEAWAGLVRLRKMTTADSSWLEAALRIGAQGLPPRREVHLRYALGKYFDDVGEYAQAFANYRRANQLGMLNRPRHDREELVVGIGRLIHHCDATWFERARTNGDPSERPIFIVGMPRSGTTLAEQIMAAHPAVFGAGELPFWNTAASAYTANWAAGEQDSSALPRLAAEYLELLRGLSIEASRVIDKMPGNFLFLGILHAALPNARFIHMCRHPIDTCLSIYFQNFGAMHSYSNDLEDLTHYYAQYVRIMEHWRGSLPPDTLLDVPYEALVQEPENWSRRMIKFIGMPWDANCLEFHRGRRPVTTFSKWQARQRINTSSVERWRHYADVVGPLGSLADGYRVA